MQPRLTFSSLLAKFTSAIAGDAAISAWITAQYGAGKHLTIQGGNDASDPSDTTAAPLVIITPLSRPITSSRSTPGSINTPVAVAFVLEAATEETDTDAGSGTLSAVNVTHAGIARAEEFAALLVDCLDSASVAIAVSFDALEVDEISSWPFVSAGFTATAYPLSWDGSTGGMTL